MATPSKESIQESEYTFPYHFIPHDRNGAWNVSRYLYWGYEYLALLETITNLIISRHPERTLDFGCGDGRLISELCKKGLRGITGVDVSERARLFSEAMIENDHRVRVVNSLEEVKGQQFDVVTAMEVLEHLPPSVIQPTLEVIHKVLRDQGCLIISVPTQNRPVNSKHYRHFTINELEREIADLFVADSVCFIHKVGVFDNLLRLAVVNRFFIPVWSPWRKFTTSLYRHFVMEAEQSNGAHLIAVLRKSGYRAESTANKNEMA